MLTILFLIRMNLPRPKEPIGACVCKEVMHIKEVYVHLFECPKSEYSKKIAQGSYWDEGPAAKFEILITAFFLSMADIAIYAFIINVVIRFIANHL